MFEDYDECRNRLDHLIHIIEALSNIKRQLSLSALDFQALTLARKSEQEEAIRQAHQIGEILESLIRILAQILPEYYHRR